MIAIIFGLLMSVVHFFSEEFCSRCKKTSYYAPLISFSAGITVTYLFLDLLPRFIAGAVNKPLFLTLLSGFVFFHIVEKYIYRHSPKDKLLSKLAIEDSVISFIYHFFIGMILVSFFALGFIEGVLFFIPFFFVTAVSTLPVDMTRSHWIKFMLASSTFLGVIFAKLFPALVDPSTYYSLLGFVIGALTFTVTRHSIPRRKEGEPLFFIIGAIVYSILLLTL